jgi:N-acetylglucosaminyl-diphospho-decaprenol L-rhamnosyltransferase
MNPLPTSEPPGGAGEAARAPVVAVVLNYNSFEDTRDCVATLLALGLVPREQIVVVDNCSPDGSGRRLQEALPDMRVVLSPRNGGFGAGLNVGFAHAPECEYYLVLNPDTSFVENNLQLALREFERDPRLGVLGFNLLNEDGSPQYPARRFYSFLTIALRRTPLVRWTVFDQMHAEHLMVHAWRGGAFEADWVMGAAFLARREAMRQVGGMDEDYFLYMEDTDLCRRMWNAGWRVKALPAVRVTHKHARASKALLSFSARQHLRSLLRYWRKHGMPLFRHAKRP